MMVLNMTGSLFLRPARPVYFVTSIALFLLSVCAFALRYYKEEFSRHAIVVQKEAEARYEPIEKSTQYYKFEKGKDIVVLKTENGWRHIRCFRSSPPLY